MKKQYKALMMDLDGTTVPNSTNGLPSLKVAEAIVKAQTKLHVGFITGRPYFHTKEIRGVVRFTGPSIASGGAQIVDTSSDEIMWERFIPSDDINLILSKLSKYECKILIQDNIQDIEFSSKIEYTTKNILSIAMMDVSLVTLLWTQTI